MHGTSTFPALAVAALCVPSLAAVVAAALPGRAPERPRADIRRAVDLIARGEYKSAEATLRKAVSDLRDTPDSQLAGAQANLGVALYYQGRYSEAETWYERALKLSVAVDTSGLEIATVRTTRRCFFAARAG